MVEGSFATSIDSAENGSCISGKAEQPSPIKIPTTTGMTDFSTDGTLTASSARTNSSLEKAKNGGKCSDIPRHCKLIFSNLYQQIIPFLRSTPLISSSRKLPTRFPTPSSFSRQFLRSSNISTFWYCTLQITHASAMRDNEYHQRVG